MLKIGDMVMRPDGKKYILVPDQGHAGQVPAIGWDRHCDHDGYLTVGDAIAENLQKVGSV